MAEQASTETRRVVTKHRVIVLTDFFKDPDDKQSLIRFLCYANCFDVEGLVATSLAYGTGEVHPEWIKEVIDEYGEVLDSLRQHEQPGLEYPSAEVLKDVVKEGAHVVRQYRGRNRGFAVPFPRNARDARSCDPAEKWLGPDQDTEASQHIIRVVDERDRRPVWVVIWGGAMDLAQALWRVRHDRTPDEAAEFVGKLRVYQISWQDTGSVWIWENFPNLFLIQSTSTFQGLYQQGDPALRNQKWVDNKVTRGHGQLGALYPRAGSIDGVKEGDSPSFLHLLAPGLSDPEQPHWGGWGGRFEPYGHGTNFFVDAEDDHPSSAADSEARRQWTVGRWTEGRSNDFAARMDWCVENYAAANHAPVAHLIGDSGAEVLRKTVAPRDVVHLTASGSSDPDGDRISYHWWQYNEAGTYNGTIAIRSADAAACSFTAPDCDSEETMHVVLEVTDAGDPPLTSYRRMIVTVRPSR